MSTTVRTHSARVGELSHQRGTHLPAQRPCGRPRVGETGCRRTQSETRATRQRDRRGDHRGLRRDPWRCPARAVRRRPDLRWGWNLDQHERQRAAQPLRTDHRPCPAVLTQPPDGCGERPGPALHQGNHRQPRTHSRRRSRISQRIATALNPVLGYEAATALVAKAIATGASIPELVRRSALFDDAVLARVLGPENLCRPDDPKAF